MSRSDEIHNLLETARRVVWAQGKDDNGGYWTWAVVMGSLINELENAVTTLDYDAIYIKKLEQERTS